MGVWINIAIFLTINRAALLTYIEVYKNTHAHMHLCTVHTHTVASDHRDLWNESCFWHIIWWNKTVSRSVLHYYLNLFVDCYSLSSSYHVIMRHWHQYEQNTFLNICECVCLCTGRSTVKSTSEIDFFFPLNLYLVFKLGKHNTQWPKKETTVQWI